FHQPRRPVAAGRPQSAAFPTRIGIVDAPIEALGVKAQRIGDAQHNHPAVLERDQAIIEVARRDWHVFAQAQGVVLIDPGVVARLGAVLTDTLESRAWILVERPALWTMLTRRRRAV